MLSEILSIQGDKLLCSASADKIPKIGSKVVSGKKVIGSVVDIIGSVKKPYCVIKTRLKNGEAEKINDGRITIT